MNQALTMSTSDMAGAPDLGSVPLVINNSPSLSGARALANVATQNVFKLLNDTGTAPAGTVAPGQSAIVTVTGCSGVNTFVPTSVIQCKGFPLTTTYQNSLFLTATVPASLITTKGTGAGTVNTPDVGTSPSVTFTIN